MKKKPLKIATLGIAAAVCGTSFAGDSRDGIQQAATAGAFADPTGIIETITASGTIDTTGAFFQSLGTNGRSCATCHVAAQAFGLSAAGARERFAATRGKDPLFAAVDGANCPSGRPGNAADHSLLLRSGLIRVSITLPASAQFTISVVHDPYGCAILPDPSGRPIVSVYRRPLPTTNLSFLSAVMFDGRETVAPLTSDATFLPNLVADLTHQAISATLGHAQAAHAPTDSQLSDIVNFELGLFTAQRRDRLAGDLTRAGAQGGAAYLAGQTYYPGINDSLGMDPSGVPFNSSSMTLFSAWGALRAANAGTPAAALTNAGRAAIAAGESLFNTFPITITNVRGLNDNPALGKPASFVGHCTTCHDAPNVGDHSLPLPLDIGTAHSSLPDLETDAAIAAGVGELSIPDLPVFLVSGCPNPFNPGQPESFYTSDPGKALLTGQCADFNRIKGPILRGLPARAPYFHNGAAANLLDLVNFYNERFQMGLTQTQKAQLIAFLASL